MATEKTTKKEINLSDVRIEKYLARLSKESDARARKLKEDSDEDLKRYIGGLKEDFQHGLSAVAEQYLGVQRTLDEHGRKLDSHREMIGELKVDMAMVKEEQKEHLRILNQHSKDLSEIKSTLSDGADKKSVIELDKRVFVLETQA